MLNLVGIMILLINRMCITNSLIKNTGVDSPKNCSVDFYTQDHKRKSF